MLMEIGPDTFILKGQEYRRLLAAEHKLKFLIEEITDREGREGMTDDDFAEQVIALAQCAREPVKGSTPGVSDEYRQGWISAIEEVSRYLDEEAAESDGFKEAIRHLGTMMRKNCLPPRRLGVESSGV